jgi:hypothetical protein
VSINCQRNQSIKEWNKYKKERNTLRREDSHNWCNSNKIMIKKWLNMNKIKV